MTGEGMCPECNTYIGNDDWESCPECGAIIGQSLSDDEDDYDDEEYDDGSDEDSDSETE